MRLLQVSWTARAFVRPIGHMSIFVPKRPDIGMHRESYHGDSSSGTIKKSLLRRVNQVDTPALLKARVR